MKISTTSEFLSTHGKGLYEITNLLQKTIQASGLSEGLATIFLRHTSASLLLFENADPTAASDLLVFLEKLVPENSTHFKHTAEGPDDMTSHIRMALTRSSESIPFKNKTPLLGTWQGIFLFEHRHAPHRREIIIQLLGT